ncbi:hypothetical protein [Ideonella sp. B508-1]|uniref:hypothetical protein n=1 Tax=Ideonella sp. B508-1 TaxID=137716 RepID=UPI0011D24F17|nr:hypothetical protein [Ideonella sp. B508-1]
MGVFASGGLQRFHYSMKAHERANLRRGITSALSQGGGGPSIIENLWVGGLISPISHWLLVGILGVFSSMIVIFFAVFGFARKVQGSGILCLHKAFFLRCETEQFFH